MSSKFLIYGSPLIRRSEIREVVKTLKSGWIGTGPRVHRFESMFGLYKGSGHVIAVSSCTAALHLAMLAIGLQPGDEVIVPVMTFAATANAVIHAGGIPVFADCDRHTMNIDPADILARITPKTKAIIPVHFGGRPCDMDRIMRIAEEKGLSVIEDCAHAVEAEYKGMKTGTIGNIGCFSFYVTKNIVTAEGGMVITDTAEYAEKIKIMALYGLSKDAWHRFGDKGYRHYKVMTAGFKYNMTDLQAAIGIRQLPRIRKYWEKRKAITELYNEEFRGLPVFTPPVPAERTRNAYHLYTLLLDTDRLSITRDQMLDEMTERGVGVGVHYLALNLHPYYRDRFGYGTGDFPEAEWVSERTLSLPLSPKLNRKDVNKVIKAVKDILRGGVS